MRCILFKPTVVFTHSSIILAITTIRAAERSLSEDHVHKEMREKLRPAQNKNVHNSKSNCPVPSQTRPVA